MQIPVYPHISRDNTRKRLTATYGEIIILRYLSEKAKQMPLVVLALESAERQWPDYINVDSANFTATFTRVPAFEDVPYPVQMFPELVVEFYSR